MCYTWRHHSLGCELIFLSSVYFMVYNVYRNVCIYIYTYTFHVLCMNLMLPTYKPNFADLACTTQKGSAGMPKSI
jgi:hypothetical protein